MLYKSDIEKIKVSLWISGFECSPNDITNIVGIKPTEIRIKGEEKWISKKATKPMINKENAWILRSELSQSVKPDEHLENILSKVFLHKREFLELTKKYDARISFGIYWDYCNPGITLDKKILQNLADLNIEVGFDMYYLGEDLRLKTAKNKQKLIEQLQQVPLINQYSLDKHNEADILVESLAVIEDECDSISGIVIPDMTDWDSLDEEDWNSRLAKLSIKLKEIKNVINKSMYLKNNS